MKQPRFLSTELNEKLKIEKKLHRKWIPLIELHHEYWLDLDKFLDKFDTKQENMQIYVSGTALERWHKSRFSNGKWDVKPNFLDAGQMLESYIEQITIYESGKVEKRNIV
jgi:hypothetical protein